MCFFLAFRLIANRSVIIANTDCNRTIDFCVYRIKVDKQRIICYAHQFIAVLICFFKEFQENGYVNRCIDISSNELPSLAIFEEVKQYSFYGFTIKKAIYFKAETDTFYCLIS